MESSRIYFLRFSIALTCLFFSFATEHFNLCDAKAKTPFLHGSRVGRNPNMRRSLKQLKVLTHLDNSNSNSYGTRFHFSLPPFDSLATLSVSENSCPYCAYPPLTTPQAQAQAPAGYSTTKPPVYPPTYMASPSPPYQLEPTPRKQTPTPPKNVPIFPPVNKPPIVFQPPSSAQRPPQFAVWCVAKSSVPDLVIQAAMDYACGTGADCKAIQANGLCFVPNTLIAHASYAFNSYWQNSKLGGGTCDFGGIAMLVTVDPSFNGCHFIFK